MTVLVSQVNRLRSIKPKAVQAVGCASTGDPLLQDECCPQDLRGRDLSSIRYHPVMDKRMRNTWLRWSCKCSKTSYHKGNCCQVTTQQ